MEAVNDQGRVAMNHVRSTGFIHAALKVVAGGISSISSLLSSFPLAPRRNNFFRKLVVDAIALESRDAI